MSTKPNWDVGTATTDSLAFCFCSVWHLQIVCIEGLGKMLIVYNFVFREVVHELR
jgi:hypothetical protein